MTEYDLEQAIDSTSLSHILETLATICAEKGDHIRTNWGDKVTARQWERMAHRLTKLIDKCEV